MEPNFKKRLYRALAMHDSTLKDWFLHNANRLCEETEQPMMDGIVNIKTGVADNKSNLRKSV